MAGPPEDGGAAPPDGVRAVLLDAGNTLVFVSPDRMLEMFGAADLAVDLETYRAAELAARLAFTRRLMADPSPSGTEAYVWREYFETIFVQCGVAPDATAPYGDEVRRLHGANRLWTHVHEGTPGVLSDLRAAGYRLGVVSNADGRVATLLEDLGLTEHLEFVVDSGAVGFEKPDRRIFDLAVKRLGVAPDQCLYVGDLYPVDVLGARRAGLRAVLVDPWDAFADRDVDRIASVAELPAYLRDIA